MNRLRRHHRDLGLTREESSRREIALLGPFTVRVFSQHGKLPGQRYEMNARGEGFDPLLCRAPHSDEDGRLRDVRNAAYGCFGFGAPIVRSHLSERPLLP
jgi:hypothetical protein